jgi:polysaccharide biosynthesis transport protein
MTILQIWVVVRARYRIVLAALLACIALALAAGAALPRYYSAHTMLYFDVLASDVVGGSGSQQSPGGSPSYLPTQVEVMTSDAVAQRVVARLNLTKLPELRAAWLSATSGRGDEAIWIGRRLVKDLVVQPKPDSNIVTLSYRSTDPAFAAQVVNAFAQEYRQTMIDVRNAPARQTAQWLAERLKSAQADVERSQQKLVAFQRENGVASVDERVDTDLGRLAQLAQQLVAVQGENTDLASKLAAGQPASTSSDVSSKLRTEIADAQARLDEAALNLGTQHPVFRQLKARLAALQAERAAEQRRLTGAVRTDSDAGRLREERVDASLDAQRNRAIEAAARRADLNTLIAERDNAQATFRDVAQRYAQASLLAHAVQTNVSVMTPAAEPTVPSSLSLKAWVLAGLALGLLLGLGLAFVCELIDRRVRTDGDVEDLLGAPVLGAPLPGRPTFARRIAAWSNA